jgi:phosphate transport system permease protein
MDSTIRSKIIANLLRILAGVSILITILIVISLVTESWGFFKKVSLSEFLFSTMWNPRAEHGQFGVVPLLVGTFMIVVISLIIAMPLGLGAAIYMSEYASYKVRRVVKPMLELLAGIPSVVYGLFALKYITPVIQTVLPQTSIFNALSASIAVGIMITPTIASLSEDALNSVPLAIKEASLALGATKFETVVKIIIPTAFSGITSAFILGVSRAIGETMIVAIAAGASPTLNLNPLESIQTMTGFIVNKVQGEVVIGTIEYQTIYAVALLLFVITLVFNIVAKRVVKRYQVKYN